MQNKMIPDGEMKFHPLSFSDDVGRLFWWKGELMREMSQTAIHEFRQLWDSGLIQELQKRDLMPRVELTDYSTSRGGGVIRLEVIPFVSYPCEWSYEMLRDAGRLVLEVNLLAKTYGYELKDAHGYNVVFREGRPLFVDLGSFVKREAGASGWLAEDEFRRFYLHPLKIWSISGSYVARRLLLGGPPIANFDIGRLTSCLERRIPERVLKFHYYIRERIARLKVVGDDTLMAKAGPLIGGILKKARYRRCWPFRDNREICLRKRLSGLRSLSGKTDWSGYHQKLRLRTSPRVERVLSIVRGLSPETILDVACNEGEFSLRFEQLEGVRQVIALDADPMAIDFLYTRLRNEGRRITPVLSDCMLPLVPFVSLPQTTRWRVDVVVALALTHHLMLTQGYCVDFVLSKLAAFSRRYLLIEFMPLGLSDGEKAPPVPTWYTVDWFRAAFSRHCTEVYEEVLEDNRILFCGVVRGVSG